jgi:hypothetical protein
MRRKLISTATRRTVATAALAIASAMILGAQDFTVRMKDQDGKIAVYYIARNAVRNVSSYPVETDVIYRIEQGKIITLNPKQKTYTEVTMAEVREKMSTAQIKPQQQEMMHRMGLDAAPTITNLGAGETIAGYATEKYSIKTPLMQGESWIAPELEVPAGYRDMTAAFFAGQVPGIGQLFKGMKTVKGFVLKSASTSSMPMMKGVVFTEIATSVEKSPIPASTFEPPAGYTKVALARQ